MNNIVVKHVVAMAVLCTSAGAFAADSVAYFRLVPATENGDDCRILDAVLARVHTLTRRRGDVELTSPGGIEGRMSEVKPGMYRIAFELEGRRLDVIADLLSADKTLTVTERDRSCRWLAQSK